MTNAEKYLKDGISIEELIFDIINFEKCWNRKDFDKEVKRIKKFFFTSSKPVLTEDEKVILRNIQDFNYIERNERGGIELNLRTDDGDLEDTDRIVIFDHLFNCIKDGEEYSIKELLNDD